MGLRQITQFLFAVSKPYTQNSPRAKGIERVNYLKTQIMGIFPWFHKCKQAIHPVFGMSNQPYHHWKCNDNHPEEMKQVQPGNKQQYHKPGADYNCCAKIRLDQDHVHEGPHN